MCAASGVSQREYDLQAVDPIALRSLLSTHFCLQILYVVRAQSLEICMRACCVRRADAMREAVALCVVNGFCRGATIPAISICDNQIMRSSRADYQFVPFNFMLINSPRSFVSFVFSHLRHENNLTKIYNTEYHNKNHNKTIKPAI